MTTDYSFSVDEWFTESERWRFVSREILESKHPEMIEDDSDIGYPMMLYAYPLRIHEDPDYKTIKKLYGETACCVVQDNESDDYALALTGGGMDLSQDIGMAYLIVQGNIPLSLCHEISRQEGLRFSGKKFRRLMRGILKTYTDEQARIEEEKKDLINRTLKGNVIKN